MDSTLYVVESPERVRLLTAAGFKAALPTDAIPPDAEVIILAEHSAESDPGARECIARIAAAVEADPAELLARMDDGAPSRAFPILSKLTADGARVGGVLSLPVAAWGSERTLRETLALVESYRRAALDEPGRPVTIAGPNGLLITFEAIMRDPLPPVSWLVEELIPVGDRVLFYGEFGSMKSWVLLDLALHLAAGRSWLDTFRIPSPKRVLYVDEEMNERTLRRRIKRLALGAGLDGAGLPLCALSRRGLRFDSTGVSELQRILGQEGFDPEVIIVEAMRRVLIGSENEASDVAGLWRAIGPLVRDGRTFVMSHHMRKPSRERGNDPRDRASGSTDILAGCDTAFAVERLGAGLSNISRQKGREGEDPAPFVVTLDAPGEDGPAVMRCADVSAMGGRVGAAVRRIEAYMTGEPDREATRRELVQASGEKESTAERAIKQLERTGRLAPVRRGVYRWGPAGIASRPVTDEAMAAPGPSLQAS